MAYFNEDNVTEQMCIDIAKEAGYIYSKPDDLRDAKSDIIVEPLLQQALIKINRITIAEAQIVIQKVKDVIYQGLNGDIITANQNLRNLFFKENSFPFGRNGEHKSISFFDTNPETASKNNTYVVTNQWEYPKSSYSGGKRLDIVLLINGMPMVMWLASGMPALYAVTLNRAVFADVLIFVGLAAEIVNDSVAVVYLCLLHILCSYGLQGLCRRWSYGYYSSRETTFPMFHGVTAGEKQVVITLARWHCIVDGLYLYQWRMDVVGIGTHQTCIECPADI